MNHCGENIPEKTLKDFFETPNHELIINDFTFHLMDQGSRIIIDSAESTARQINLAEITADEKYLCMSLKDSVTTGIIELTIVEPDALPNETYAYAFDLADGDSSINFPTPIIVIGTGDMRVSEPGSMFQLLQGALIELDLKHNNADANNKFFFEWTSGTLILYAMCVQVSSILQFKENAI